MDAYADGTPLPDDNTASWYSFAQRPYEQGGLGLAPHQAAGVVGNLMQESGGGIPSWGPTGDNGTAWGAAQWRNDRLSGLQNFAKSNGMDPKSTEAQQAWMRQELSTTHSGAYDALQNAATPEDAANAFNKLYEISADKSGQRAANARALFQGGPAAIAQAAGIPKSAGTGALALSGDDDEEDGDSTGSTPALAQQPGALSPGGSKMVMKGDKTNKLAAFGQMLTSVAAGLASGVNPAQSQALLAQAKLMNDQSQSKYKTFIGKDGTIYRQDDSGNIMSVPGGQSASATKPIIKDIVGPDGTRVTSQYNPQTAQWAPVRLAGAVAAPPINSIDDLRNIDPHRADAAQAVADGRIQFPNASRLNPAQMQLKNDTIAAFPGVDANVFSARKRFQDEKASSNPTSFGGLIGRSDIAADQLDKTLDSYGNIGNTRSMFGAEAAKAENYLSAGGDQQKRHRTELETNSGNAASDINSIQNGGRGSAGERETIKNGLNLPYDSPVVQSGAVQAHIDALKSGIQARFNQEAAQMGQGYVENDPDYKRLMAKLATLQDKADKLYKGDFSYAAPTATKAASAPSTPTAPAALPKGWSVTVH